MTNAAKIDAQYRHTNGRLHWLVIRVFRPLINGFAKSVIGRAYERGIINSFALHELAAIIDRSLYPTQERGDPGQAPSPATPKGSAPAPLHSSF